MIPSNVGSFQAVLFAVLTAMPTLLALRVVFPWVLDGVDWKSTMLRHRLWTHRERASMRKDVSVVYAASVSDTSDVFLTPDRWSRYTCVLRPRRPCSLGFAGPRAIKPELDNEGAWLPDKWDQAGRRCAAAPPQPPQPDICWQLCARDLAEYGKQSHSTLETLSTSWESVL